MSAIVSYIEKDGNTVPYAPIFDDIRQNHGYIETRDQPENVDIIPEASRSDALRGLLLDCASRGSAVATLGCDLGEHRFPKKQLSSRWLAGGYVQLLPTEKDEDGHSVLRPIAKTIERIVTERVEQDNWELELALTPVRLVFGEEQYVRSVEVWFHAMASSRGKAIASRERLILTVHEAIRVFQSHYESASPDAPMA
jgi:hypothetical protein